MSYWKVPVRRQRWPRGCAMVLGALLIALIGACSLGTIVVQRGAIQPIWFDRSLGSLRLVGYSTWNANCPPFVGCEPTLHEAYVVWLIREQPDAGGSAARRLLNLPVERGP